MTSRRSFMLLLVLGMLGAGGYALCSQQAPQPAAIQLPTVAATMGDVEEVVLASGALEPIRQVSVGAQVSGRLISLKVTLGQNVSEGDLIAEIDGVTQQNELRSAEAELAVLQAQREERLASLAYAESVLARQKQMLGQNAVSRDNYESAEMTVRTTRAQIAALDAQIISGGVKVETARAKLGYTRITAPAAGTVLAIVTQEGQTVNAAQSAPTIIVLGDVSTMTVKAKISEADVLRVKAGQEALFSVLGAPDRRFPGRIAFVEPAPDTLKTQNTSSASASSGTNSSSTSSAIYYNALFEVPNSDGRLLTSMTVQVTVVVGRVRGVVTVPSTAIRRRGGELLLDVVGDDGKPAPRKVTVGLDNKIVAEISSGLKAGERVVVAHAGSPAAARRMRGPLGF
ncbi:efflux RND transporter periplasmic adaptor subunit [Bosea sp. BIWAKO-01]|uniref:efflux RND transporter periplasmic adaptor subunit n=1 Tax=Bosea sp. BIWAKO-01 TaxID=506668 RepID=UPI00086D4C36|nr:efflux RND transporter periplasmic adaptor subunit [Bosea sp. BIWAKO-01]GAU85152.1 macrolide-specific efflux protein MacA [Bosea sp. BIWAKO-01]